MKEDIMNINTLNILSDAISDVGSWHWWVIKDDMVQIQFCDIQLYDNSKPEKEAHTTDVLAVRFYGHSFAVFLDNLDEKNWHIKLQDDDSILYPIEPCSLAFDNRKEAELLLHDYKNKIPVKDFINEDTLLSAKHILCARCGDVGCIAGGDQIVVVGQNGEYTEEEIETASKKWWDYWEDYWKVRGTKEAYSKDYVCEITIPIVDDEMGIKNE